MTTYRVTIRSILYETYKVEAETEEQIRETYSSKGFFSNDVVTYNTEDTEIYDITPEGD